MLRWIGCLLATCRCWTATLCWWVSGWKTDRRMLHQLKHVQSGPYGIKKCKTAFWKQEANYKS